MDCAGRQLDLSSPQVMGILNVTPDSFSDGGQFQGIEQALEHGRAMQSEGAAMIDVGGESTRPGALEISLQEELDRVIPVIEGLTACVDIPVSIDTSKADVMREAVNAGAGMINDVFALQAEGALSQALASKVPVCLMHMRGRPGTMQQNPEYGDVVDEVLTFLGARMEACVEAGIARSQLIIDPGFGFGKTVQDNCRLLASLDRFSRFGIPILVGLSRKSMIGAMTGREVNDRLAGSLSAAVMAVQSGASILRVHDVAATVDALKMVVGVKSYATA